MNFRFNVILIYIICINLWSIFFIQDKKNSFLCNFCVLRIYQIYKVQYSFSILIIYKNTLLKRNIYFLLIDVWFVQQYFLSILTNILWNIIGLFNCNYLNIIIQTLSAEENFSWNIDTKTCKTTISYYLMI